MSPRYLLLLPCLIGAGAVSAQSPEQPPGARETPATRVPPQAEVQVLDHIVAIVNDGLILASDLEAELGNVVRELRRNNRRVPPDDALRKQVLERLILLQAQVQRARQLGISVTSAQVNDAVQRIAQNNRMSLSAFREALLREGYDYRRFRDDLQRDLLINQVRRREVEQSVEISEQEIDEHLATTRQETQATREHKLRHIFIGVAEGSGPERINAARERILEIRAQLLAGEDFAALATRVSEGQRALEGGDLGWRTFAQMPNRFAAVVESLAVGDISEPIRSAVGFHLLKLEGVRGEQRHIVAETRARHILLRTNVVRTDEEARAQLVALRQRALDGEAFEDLAREFSEDHASAAKGGDLGWFAPGAMVPEFEEAIAGLRPGELSEPFRTSFGWHVATVLERRESDETEEFLRRRAREQLWKTKVESETELWLRRLRDEAYVELLQPV